MSNWYRLPAFFFYPEAKGEAGLATIIIHEEIFTSFMSDVVHRFSWQKCGL